MSMSSFDVVVIGGGPAGMGAATRASSLGLRTVLIEEGPATGGQVYRPLPAPFSTAGKEHPGDALRRQLRASEATVLLGHAVWNVSDGYRVDVVGPRGTERVDATALILATGTHERFVPVKGWTLPGVIGLGAATVLMKSQHILPGRNVVVAGAGPLLLLVAAMILEAGGRVAALVDLNGVTDWAARLPVMLSRPDLIWQGSQWWSRRYARARPCSDATQSLRSKATTPSVGCSSRPSTRAGACRRRSRERFQRMQFVSAMACVLRPR